MRRKPATWAAALLLGAALSACGSGERSAPAARPAVVWAVGDGADGSAESKALADRIARERPARFLYLGDVYGSERFADGSAQAFREFYDAAYGALASRTSPTPGNHEWPRRAEGYYPYWKEVTGRKPADYYAFRLGGWELLSLNSEAPHAAGGPQARWLAEQLSEPGTCRLAFWHRPRHSDGKHGDQADVAPLWDPLAGRAAIVVTGHDHDLQRFEPVDGITQFVAGAGGSTHYEIERGPGLAFSEDRTPGALRLELTSGLARYAFVTADGRRLDGGVVRCRPLAG